MTIISGLPASEDRIKKLVSSAISINANNTTASVVVFTVTGAVLIHCLWLEITDATDLTNHTAGHFRLNDQSATVDITAAAPGATLSGMAAGSIAIKNGLAAASLGFIDNSAGAILEPGATSDKICQEVAAIKKDGAVTTIDYHYTTTDAPANAQFTFHALWEPLSADGNLA